MATPNFTEMRIKLIPPYSLRSCSKFETLVVFFVCNSLFIAMRIYPCAHACIWFLHLSLYPDVCLRIHDRWRADVDSLELPGFPALLWDTLKDFGYTAYPEYSARGLMTTCQLLRWEVQVKSPVCPTHPAWEEWESKV
jgi:hypothetical protein